MTTHGHGQIVITCAHLTLTCRKLSRSRLFVLFIMSVIQLRPHTCGLVRIELRSCSCHKRTALESIWDRTSECNYCVHTGPNKKHWGGGNYTQVQSRSSKACMGVTQKHILIYTRKLVVQIRLIRPRHDLKTATVTCYTHSVVEDHSTPKMNATDCSQPLIFVVFGCFEVRDQGYERSQPGTGEFGASTW